MHSSRARFDQFTRDGGSGPGSTIWTGESGVLVVIVVLLFAFAFALVLRPWPVRRSPEEEPASTVSAKTA
jgi:hypothetical protein